MSGDYLGPLHETPTAPATLVRRQIERPHWIEAPGIYRLRFLGDPILHEIADPFMIETDGPHLQGLVTAMEEVVEAHKALGLSAPQVGAKVRVIVAKLSGNRSKLTVMINPVLRSTSWKETRRLEGCLSIPGFATHLTRYDGVTVSYLNDRFEVVEETVVGVPAQIIQHELDHLEGVLITDDLSEKNQELARSAVAKARATK